jgi:hypothetical protein
MVERRWGMVFLRRGMGSGGGAGFGDELCRGEFDIEEGCFSSSFFPFSLDEVKGIFGILKKLTIYHVLTNGICLTIVLFWHKNQSGVVF